MNLRSGKEYTQSLQDGRRIILDGKVLDSISEHPAFKPTVRTVARLIDLHGDHRFAKLLVEQHEGNSYPACYKPSRSKEDVIRQGKIIQRLSLETFGQMGRLYNYAGAYVLGFYENRAHLSAASNVIEKFYDRFRNEFLHATIAFADSPSTRGPSSGKDEILRIVERKKEGIVVSGVKNLATGAPYSDEILVLKLGSHAFLEHSPGDQVVSFFVPTNAKGLTLLCRGGLADQGVAGKENPLAPFDEIDACLIFENVFIPNDRILYDGDVEIADRMNKIVNEVSRHNFCRRLEAKFGIFWQLAKDLVRLLGVEQKRGAQDAVFSIGRHYATLSRLVRDAENSSRNSDFPAGFRADVTSLNLALDYALKHSTEITRSLELIGGQAFAFMPSENDLISKTSAQYYAKVLRTSSVEVQEKVRTLRLARELVSSLFAGRQELFDFYALGNESATRAALESNLAEVYKSMEKRAATSFADRELSNSSEREYSV